MVKRAGQPRYATFSMEFERDKILAKVNFRRGTTHEFLLKLNENQIYYLYHRVLYIIKIFKDFI